MNEEQTYNEGDGESPVETNEGREESGETPTPLRSPTKEVSLDCGILNAEGERLRETLVSKMKGSDRKDIGVRECLNNGGKLISRLLMNKLEKVTGLNLKNDKDKVVKGMLSADRSRLMLEIYQLTKRRDFITVTVTCPVSTCEAVNEVDFKIKEFPFKKFDNFRRDPQRNIFVFDAEFDVFDDESHKATFRFPNGYDEEATIPLLRKNPVEAGHRMLQRTIVAYDGNNTLPETFIADLDTEELDALSEAFQDGLPGVELTPAMKCFDCGEEATVTVDIADFFFGKSPKTKRK